MKSVFNLLRVFFFGKRDEEVAVEFKLQFTLVDVVFIVVVLLVILFMIFK